jgi:hypothetical protein
MQVGWRFGAMGVGGCRDEAGGPHSYASVTAEDAASLSASDRIAPAWTNGRCDLQRALRGTAATAPGGLLAKATAGLERGAYREWRPENSQVIASEPAERIIGLPTACRCAAAGGAGRARP